MPKLTNKASRRRNRRARQTRTPETISASNEKIISDSTTSSFRRPREVLAAAHELLQTIRLEGLADDDTQADDMVQLGSHRDTQIQLNRWASVAFSYDEAVLSVEAVGYKDTGWGEGTYSWEGNNTPTARILKRLKRLQPIREADEVKRTKLKAEKAVAFTRSEALVPTLAALLTATLKPMRAQKINGHARGRVMIRFSDSLRVILREAPLPDTFDLTTGKYDAVTLAAGRDLSAILSVLLALQVANPGTTPMDEDDDFDADYDA